MDLRALINMNYSRSHCYMLMRDIGVHFKSLSGQYNYFVTTDEDAVRTL